MSSYYDKISKQWHDFTGYKGGALKALVLNNILLNSIQGIDGYSILELGAGNGYFMSLLIRRFSGQKPSSIVITDISLKQLEIAKKNFRIPGAEYLRLDVGRRFPFDKPAFDIILATMVFNEVSHRAFRNAVSECHRLMIPGSMLLITVTHPRFVRSLKKRGMLKRINGLLTMPGHGSLRLPIVNRSLELYRKTLSSEGFQFTEEDFEARMIEIYR